MHDYSVIYIILWAYFIIPACLLFLLIWFFTKNIESSHKVKILRIAPFSFLLTPAILPDSSNMGSVLLPSIIGVVIGSPLEKLIYLSIILSFTLVGWLMYIFIEKTNDQTLKEEMAFQDKQKKMNLQKKLKKIK